MDPSFSPGGLLLLANIPLTVMRLPLSHYGSDGRMSPDMSEDEARAALAHRAAQGRRKRLRKALAKGRKPDQASHPDEKRDCSLCGNSFGLMTDRGVRLLLPSLACCCLPTVQHSPHCGGGRNRACAAGITTAVAAWGTTAPSHSSGEPLLLLPHPTDRVS